MLLLQIKIETSFVVGQNAVLLVQTLKIIWSSSTEFYDQESNVSSFNAIFDKH